MNGFNVRVDRLYVAVLLATFVVLAGLSACTRDDDGSIPVSSEDDAFSGSGFFRQAWLDSGNSVHLVSDTLYLKLDSLWTFSNCALKRIEIDTQKDGSAFVLYPKILIESDGSDCPSPFLHPDTTLALVYDREKLEGASVVRVENDEGRVLDTILLRRGSFDLDTFNIYIDSLFDSVAEFPLRTKGSPSVLRMLDSLTPRVFYWKPMESNCELRIDMCDSVVNDTIFPASWCLVDTALVPIRKACASTDSVYCVSNRWVNDSSSVGNVQERSDTLWHTSLYYVEEIPECATMNLFKRGSFVIDKNFTVVRELVIPDEEESECGPSALKDLYIYDIGRNRVFPDSLDADAIRTEWKSAKKVSK